jgi:hypothetical protein
MAHTPGPWRFPKPGKYGAVVAECPHEDREQCPVCKSIVFDDGYRSSNYDGYGGHLICESVSDGDTARVIVASPDLLAELRLIVEGWARKGRDLTEWESERLEFALVAVAKAEGRDA